MTEPFALEFLDDYFAESEEHLAALRAAVLAFEEGGAGWAPAQVKAVQRSLHTMKGLAGMVGFEEIERTAHALEDLVRWSLQAGDASGRDAVTLLYRGVQLLDRALAARRGGSAVEGTRELAAEIEALSGGDRAVPVSGADVGGSLIAVRFAPTAERLARGIGVESVRERLSAIGSIRTVAPRVPEQGGGVEFHFVVQVPEGWEPDPSWRQEGIEWQPHLPEDEPAAAAARRQLQPGGAPGNVVRVDMSRLDELMRMVGELVVSRARLDDALRELAAQSENGRLPDLIETSEVMERQLRTLREGVMRVRLVPIGELFERLRFAVRDLARETGKDVAVDVVGADTEIDRLVVDRMMEPLLHLVRNAVSHGVERADERARRGKPRQARIALRAAASGDRIRIEVEDDGAGVDADAVMARAEASGIAVERGAMDGGRILDLLCAPGLSTRAEADRASGRGIGMEVVRSTVRGLNGELSMRTEPGRGTLFAVDLPLTLMIVDALVVRVGAQTMAVPQPVLREVLKVEESAVTPMGGGEIISYRGGVLPLLRLADHFGMAAEPRAAAGSFHVLVVGDEGARVGLAVDGLGGLREIVVHPVDDPLVAAVGVGGATELSDGRLGLILDAPALTRELRAARRRAPTAAGTA